MKLRLKKLKEQVIVLTGASSGIGLVTARMAARRGARLVLAARSEQELQRLAQEIQTRGGQAIAVAADVAEPQGVARIAAAALERFGRFDTWVNDAGISVFGRLDEIPMEDQRRVFETNFWGTVYGSLTAVKHLRRRGGALINIGSVVSDRAFPLQGMYSASKHAVKGFTDALRLELEHERAPISVTLIKPTAIATPFARHAGNYLPVEPTLPPPIYAPELVAKAILYCAEHPEREFAVGEASKLISAMSASFPRLTDKYQEWTSFRQQKTDQPARGPRQGSLYQASHDLAERAPYPYHVFETSPYTQSRLHPVLAGAAVLGTGLVLGGLWGALRQAERTRPRARRPARSIRQESAR